MKSNKTILKLTLALSMSFSLAGCGGFSGRQSVSPATFLLPGILKANPQPVPADSTVPQPPTNSPEVQAL